MKTAIIYRSNEALDAKLSDLQEKVAFFKAFPADFGEEVISSSLESLLPELDVEQILCDGTCYPYIAVPEKVRVKIIKQQDGFHEDYIRSVAMESIRKGIDVILVPDRLADHCEVEGIDPYQISREERDGWYLDKVFALWKQILTDKGVHYDVVGRDYVLEQCSGKLVICDHHNPVFRELQSRNEKQELIWKNSFCSEVIHFKYVEHVAVFGKDPNSCVK